MERLLKLVDYFALPHFGRDKESDTLYRSRVLSSVLLLICLQSAIAFIYMPLADPFPRHNLLMALLLPAPVMLSSAAGLWILRTRGQLSLACNMNLWLIAVAIALSTIATGGPVASGVSFTLAALPILALNVLGGHAALRWLGIATAMECLLLIGEEWLALFPTVTHAQIVSAHTVTWLLVAFGITAFAWGSAMHSNRLRSELMTERARFEHLASHDSLTDLANRNLFEARLTQALRRASLMRESVMLMYIDLVDFKGVNDRYGHQTGDLVLQIMSQRLRHNTRPTDTVARLGGDEMAVILEGVDLDNVPTIVSALSDKLLQPCNGTPGSLVVNASIGVAVYPLHAATAPELIARADEAMYSAKRKRKAWQMWEPEQH